MEYDEASNDKDKDKALEELKSVCYWNNEYERPGNLKKIKKSENKEGDTSEEEDSYIQSLTTALD